MAYPWTVAALQAPSPPIRSPASWLRVSRERPCPICGKPDWCSVTADGDAACCMRIADGAVRSLDMGHGVGHIHRLRDDRPAPTLPQTCHRPAPPPRRSFDLDYDAILRRWTSFTATDVRDAFAEQLGVSPQSLRRMDAVYCPERRAWAFPMHDDRRCVVGIRLRSPAGDKFALPGSKAGVFVPAGLDSRSRLLICEGPTDTAAALTLGFQAIGRPSCSGGTDIICNLLQHGRRRDVIIVADLDGPGRFGARQLADRLYGLCASVRIITAAPHKDLRQWLTAGCDGAAVQLRIDHTYPHVPCGEAPMDWIKMDSRLTQKIEVVRLAGILGVRAPEVVGLCHLFWVWAGDQTEDGVLKECSIELIDHIVGHAGFADGLIKVGWLKQKGESLEIPNWSRHNSESAKKRAMANLRQQKHRTRNGQTDEVSRSHVTEA